MQTLYTKLTRERAPQFQQSTKIVEDNGKRLVIKEPLTEECNDHIRRMSENYTFFKNKGFENLCPVDYKDGKLFFTFLKGKSFCDELLESAKLRDYDEFVKKILAFKSLILSLAEESQPFCKSDEFSQVFGQVELDGKKAAKKLNIDMIFENVININGIYKTIDYEWIFDFLIPYEFIYFRAINSFYIKYSKDLNGFITRNSVYELLEVQQKDIETYLKMDSYFLSYVYGPKYNYDNILLSYRKDAYPIEGFSGNISSTSQLFYDTGDGFNENQCITKSFSVRAKDRVELFFEIPENVSRLRFDPSDKPVILDFEGAYTNNCDSKNHMIFSSTNASVVLGSFMVFADSDPQIIFDGLLNKQTIYIVMQVISDKICDIEEKLDLVTNHFQPKIDVEKSKCIELQECNKNLEDENKKLVKMNSVYREIINSLKLGINK